MAGRGGVRIGAGRKAGVPNKKSQELIARAEAQGVTPLEVMTENMRFWYEGAQKITDKLRDAVDLIKPEQLLSGGDEVQELMKLIAKLTRYRENAENCAVDAAPYLHPRLANIDFVDKTPVEHQKPTALMSPKEALKSYMAGLTTQPVQ